jgi:hypothetical protein
MRGIPATQARLAPMARASALSAAARVGMMSTLHIAS